MGGMCGQGPRDWGRRCKCSGTLREAIRGAGREVVVEMDAVMRCSGTRAELRQGEQQGGGGGRNGHCGKAQRLAGKKRQQGSGEGEEEAEMDVLMRRSGAHAAGRRGEQQEGTGVASAQLGGEGNSRRAEAVRVDVMARRSGARGREGIREAGGGGGSRNGRFDEAQRRACEREARGTTVGRRRRKWTLWRSAAARAAGKESEEKGGTGGTL
ncbi:hypothetical protein BGW80DRAFT_1546202 [Lactifluus volemus]|nr:hypothetical protein BGW80DRAFT_1546202 [Lactifluus volemus]